MNGQHRSVHGFYRFGLVLWLVSANAHAGHPPPRFATSDRCLACHNGLFSHTGEDVSIGTDWRSSVMANAARDPYWQAAVRRELLDHPDARGLIENECTRCHMPMATAQANLEHRGGELFRHLGPPPDESDEDRLALDGVSCSICHQITAARLGDPSTFTGHFGLDTATPWGRRQEFGPFAVDLSAPRWTIRMTSRGPRVQKRL
jgi:hypothetical protein